MAGIAGIAGIVGIAVGTAGVEVGMAGMAGIEGTAGTAGTACIAWEEGTVGVRAVSSSFSTPMEVPSATLVFCEYPNPGGSRGYE